MNLFAESTLGQEATSSMPSSSEAATLMDIGAVLVIDDDPFRRAALVCNVARAGASSVIGVSSGECQALPSLFAPRLVVTMIATKHGLAPEVLALLELSSQTAAILLGPGDADSIRARLVNGAARVHTLPLPASPREIATIVRRYGPVRGVLGPFTPAEYVQQAGLGSHSVTLFCVDAAGQELGSIVMLRGHVHSARQGAARGFEAFASLVTRTEARVLLGDAVEGDADVDLMAHWQSLVLESMRQYDERERGVVIPRHAAPESDFSELISDTPPGSGRDALTRAASIPALPVTEMRETLGSTRGASKADVRALVEDGVRAVIEQDYPRAIARLEQALAADPRNATVRHRLDRLYAIVAGKR
jgi:hypothetical protein